MVFVEYRDSISAHHLLQSQLDGSFQVHLAVDLRVFDELNEHFGICVGFEGITFCLQTLFEDRVVLDDTVMDDSQTL